MLSLVEMSLQTLPPRTNTESARHIGTEKVWFVRPCPTVA